MTSGQSRTSGSLERLGFPRDMGVVGAVAHKAGNGVLIVLDDTGAISLMRPTGRGLADIDSPGGERLP